MSDRIAAIISGEGVISLVVDGNAHLVDRSHPNYKMVVEALKNRDADALTELVNIPTVVQHYVGDRAEVRNGEVFYEGEALHNTLTDRIIQLMEQGFEPDGMIKFLENLMDNPSARAVSELYDFLENKGLPITDDGCFLAYKGIKENWKDRYSGTIDNSVGNVVEFKRNKVDDNREHTCSYGLHCGALQYVRGYCTERVIIVKVNPRDVVSVPLDHDAQKVRVCKYEVLREYTGEIDNELPRAMYRANGDECDIPPPDDDDYWYEDDDPCDGCYEDDCDGCNYND